MWRKRSYCAGPGSGTSKLLDFDRPSMAGIVLCWGLGWSWTEISVGITLHFSWSLLNCTSFCLSLNTI